MQFIRTRYGFITVLLLGLALLVAGCGGDDGLSAEDQARIAAAEEAADQAAADKAEAERKAAEDAAEAERQRMAAAEAERQRMEAEQAEAARAASINDALYDIAYAETAEEADAIYAMVMDEANDTEDAALMQAVADRKAELATMTRAEAQMMALMTAAGNVDVTAFDLTTPAGIAAAEAAIDALKMALAAAMDVGDDDKAMYQLRLDAASAPVMAARTESDRMARIEAARQAIAMATTPAAAQAAYDAVKDDATATEGAGLQAAVDMRTAALATMDRVAAQKMVLMTVAGNKDTAIDIDITDMTPQEAQAAIDAATAAINALKKAIEDAVDVSDDDKAMYQSEVDNAEMFVMTVQSALDHGNQMMALTAAVTALQNIDLAGLTTQAAIDTAQTAIDDLQMALDDATELSDTEKATAMTELDAAERTVTAAQVRVDVMDQTAALNAAVMTLDEIDLGNLMTQAQIDEADEAIAALDLALAAATDLSDAQKLNATVDVTVAKRRVASAQTALDENMQTQRTAIMDAVEDLGEIDLDDLDTTEKITAAYEAVKALKMALDNATHVSDTAKEMYQTQYTAANEKVRMAQTGMDLDGRMAMQRTAIMTAQTTASTAVGMVSNDSDAAEVTAADDAITALKKAIADAEDLPEDHATVIAAKEVLTTLEGLLAGAKTSRQMAMDAEETTETRSMEAKALRLYEAIEPPTVLAALGEEGGSPAPTATDRAAAYGGTNDAAIVVSIGDGNVPTTAADQIITLMAEKTPVAALHGWKGAKYSHDVTSANQVPGVNHENDTYVAFVYSNIGEPTMGKKFGSAADVPTDVAALAAFEYQYHLDAADRDGNADKALTIVAATHAAQVSLSGVTRTAGTETFHLPDPNNDGEQYISVPGMLHGVSGTYSCAPSTPADGCTAAVAAKGFTLEGGTWLFIPSDPNARVLDAPDDAYASYGWWLYTNESGVTLEASAFHDQTGDVPNADGLDALNGTATYVGGAAGKYAIHSASTIDGVNDSGHFTARATLEANFTLNETSTAITGTIDQFIGADGQSRDWKVELKGSPIDDDGRIGDAGDAAATPMTVWTIDGKPASVDGGEWTGMLRNEGDDGVPQVATGTFYSTYNNTGKMVGGFGANHQKP